MCVMMLQSKKGILMEARGDGCARRRNFGHTGEDRSLHVSSPCFAVPSAAPLPPSRRLLLLDPTGFLSPPASASRPVPLPLSLSSQGSQLRHLSCLLSREHPLLPFPRPAFTTLTDSVLPWIYNLPFTLLDGNGLTFLEVMTKLWILVYLLSD